MVTRREVMVGLGAMVMSGQVAEASGRGARRMFVGTTGDVSKGIYTATWDAASGTIGEMTLAAEVPSPSFLAVERGGLFACSEVDGGAAKATAYRVTAAGLTKVNEQPTLGGGTTFISARGRGVFVANYGGGSVSSFRVGEDGGLSPAVSAFCIQREGAGGRAAGPEPCALGAAFAGWAVSAGERSGAGPDFCVPDRSEDGGTDGE